MLNKQRTLSLALCMGLLAGVLFLLSTSVRAQKEQNSTLRPAVIVAGFTVLLDHPGCCGCGK